MQEEYNYKKICIDINEEAWNKETYDAWIERFGTPEVAALRIKKSHLKFYLYFTINLEM